MSMSPCLWGFGCLLLEYSQRLVQLASGSGVSTSAKPCREGGIPCRCLVNENSLMLHLRGIGSALAGGLPCHCRGACKDIGLLLLALLLLLLLLLWPVHARHTIPDASISHTALAHPALLLGIQPHRHKQIKTRLREDQNWATAESGPPA
jgi:hypothetical protein